ncbi:MAG: dihydropteroate synthase [Ignavibacteria bacterium]|nr:dihydropteroate synthase [Ignavibacteria bacterium]
MGFPKIMGILNVTPDSFSDGGMFVDPFAAIKWGIKLLDDGADMLDIGGESTRPGSEPVSITEELRRVVPVIEGIKQERPEAIISIDTMKYEVAEAAISAGASIINDVSGLQNDIRLASLAAEKNCALIVTHMQGTPKTMQINPTYENVVEEIFEFLQNRIEIARKFGVQTVIADVGIGFGKTVEHNWELLRNLKRFYDLKVPLLLGISRKSFIGKTLNIDNPIERDLPTLLIHTLLLNQKIDIIRVHNVHQFQMLKQLYRKIYEN